MNSFFKIITSAQWEEARITGLIPKCSADIDNESVLVNEFKDLAIVCAQYFQPSDYPIALEFAPDSYAAELKWVDATEENSWREGHLNIEQLHADLVLNIYSFEHTQTDDGSVYSLQGES